MTFHKNDILRDTLKVHDGQNGGHLCVIVVLSCKATFCNYMQLLL